MKILHIGKYFLPFAGGIEHFMSSLIAEQVKQGHSVVAIAHQHQQAAENSLVNFNGADIHLLKTFGHIPFVPLSLSLPSRYRALIASFQPDIIHLHCPNIAAFWGLFLPQARKIPWVIHWHSDVLDNSSPRFIKILYPIYRQFQDAILRKAKAVIATSPAYASSSVALKNFADKITIIPLGLESVANLQRSREESSTLKLLAVGRLAYYKGYTHLLNATSLAVRQGVDLRLEIIGSGAFQSSLLAQIKNLELESRVKLLGQVTDAVRDAKLNHCDLLCLSSIERTEAFGLVLLEAMSVGKACLVSDVPGSGMSWVVVNNETGFVYKNGDSHDLARILAEIAANIEQLPVMGRAGRQRFEELFQIPVIAQKIEQLYQDILDKPIS